MGYLYAAASVLAFTLVGVSYKLSERFGCANRQVNFFFFLSGAILMIVWARSAGALTPIAPAVAIGSAIGVSGFLSVMIFRLAAAKGKISTSWTILQLSLVIPVVISIIVWRETPKAHHVLGFALTFLAILLLGVDMGRTEGK